MLEQTDVRRRFIYDPETGVFRHRMDNLPGGKAGQLAGSVNRDGYVNMSIGRKSIHAHRLAWLYVFGSLPNGMLDHIDGNRSNNRLSNLRLVTPAQNAFNKSACQRNKCGVKGVSWSKGRRAWIAQIGIGYWRKNLGAFDTIAEASAAYTAAAEQFFGEYAAHNGCPKTIQPDPQPGKAA